MEYRNSQEFFQAEQYIKEKRILDLLKNLTSMVIFNQPENPFRYMITILTKLKAAQSGQGNNPFIFSLTNAESIFHMLDCNKRGHITFKQYKHGLETLGINDYDIMPVRIGDEKIAKETFLSEAQKGLDYLSSTYEPVQGNLTAHVEKDAE